MELQEKKNLVESLLFVAGEPITLSELKNTTQMHETELGAVLAELIHEYRQRNGGMLIAEVSGGFQMVSNPMFSTWIRKLKRTSAANKLSVPALETLAIIAYKQPIIKAEIEQIRGVDSGGVIKNLLDRRLIRIMGKKEVPGKPMLYGTTREFLQYFGLKDLAELPTLKELSREEAA